MSTLLNKCDDIDMTNKTNLAIFLCDFVTSMRRFKIAFGNITFPNQANTTPFSIMYGLLTRGNSVYGYTVGVGELTAVPSNHFSHCFS